MGDLSKLAQQAMLQPQEAVLTKNSKNQSLSIGIPKENYSQEKRIPLTPFAVAVLVERGHKVVIESNAGLGANFLDQHYAEQGAMIAYTAEEVYHCDIIVKIACPTQAEINLMKKKQVLFSSQQPSLLDKQVLEALIQKQITALSYEYLQDEGGQLSFVRAMSEIVGTTSILIAGEYLSTPHDGKGLLIGGITGVPPTEMVIIGAGTVGEFAARTALALGVQVKVFDRSLFKLRRLQNNIGSRVFTSLIQPQILNKAVRSADVVIAALRAQNGRCPCVISEDTVSAMKPNSVLIDVSIDQGGCIETSEITTHENPVFRKYDVIHYGVPNITSRVARTATYAVTNILSPLLLETGEQGGMKNIIWDNPGIRSAIYLYEGNLTNKDIADKFNLVAKNLDLLIVSNL